MARPHTKQKKNDHQFQDIPRESYMETRQKITLKLAGALVITLSFLAFVCVVTRNLAPWRYSRHMKCGELTEERARDICGSIERNLEYTWFGHAIISPGYRSTWKTVIAVWCEQQIKREDMNELHALSDAEDWRLASASESLLRLLTGNDQYGYPEAETSIFNPSNPSYLLRDGCKSRFY
jgi:hypothetical protein